MQLGHHESASLSWILINGYGKKQTEAGTERHSCNSKWQGFMQPREVIGVEEESILTAAIQEVMCIIEGKT